MAAKITYDTVNRLFIVNSGVTVIDAKIDLYSDAKEDWLTDPTLRKFKFPILAIGGNQISPGKFVSPFYILQHGWKVRPQEADHTLTIQGNLITSDASPVFVTTLGAFNVFIDREVTSNSLTVSTGAAAIADIWNHALDGAMTAKELMAIMAAVLAGKVSGAGTGTEVFRDVNDVKDRVIATVDNSGNRSQLIIDGQ